jgi:hypothetical protein
MYPVHSLPNKKTDLWDNSQLPSALADEKESEFGLKPGSLFLLLSVDRSQRQRIQHNTIFCSSLSIAVSFS